MLFGRDSVKHTQAVSYRPRAVLYFYRVDLEVISLATNIRVTIYDSS